MMKANSFISILFVVLFFSACTPPKPSEQPQQPPEPPIPSASDHTIGAILYHQYASEYKALCYQAYTLADMRLEEKLKSNPAKPAIITDLDETVLDNSYYNAWLVQENKAYTPDTWMEWTSLEKATALEGSLDFFRKADSLGVTLFYLSNRKVEEQLSTMNNMKALGYPQVDSSHYYLKTTTSGKQVRRDEILAQGYNVLLYLGDNLSDFTPDFDKKPNDTRDAELEKIAPSIGKDFIVFPNALYGTWEGALYNNDFSLSDIQKDSLRRKSLIGFN